MEVEAKHVQLRHQLNDDLQVEQTYTCFMDTSDGYPKPVLIDALKETIQPVINNFKDRYQFRGANTLTAADYAYPASYYDNTTTTTDL